MLNLRMMLTGKLNRLSIVQRFNNAHRHQNESVAQHTFYVAFYAFHLANWVNMTLGTYDIDYSVLYGKAIHHDIEEAVSGDFPRNFKYSSPAVKKALDVAADGAYFQAMDFTEPRAFFAYWLHAKDENSVEGRIVAFADLLSCVSFVWNETKLGNMLILEQAGDLPANVRNFCEHEQFQLFAPFFDDLKAIVLEAYGIR